MDSSFPRSAWECRLHRSAALPHQVPMNSRKRPQRSPRASTPVHPFLFVLGAIILLAPQARAAAERPNIIIVMPDDVGYGDFACLGSPIIRTPNIDAFWKQSLRFTDFHVSPTCSPTRSALMTGRHEFKSGVTH